MKDHLSAYMAHNLTTSCQHIMTFTMKTTTALSVLLLSATSDAFAPPTVKTTTASHFGIKNAPQHSSFVGRSVAARYYASPTDTETTENEVDRLRSMAAKLRGEVAELEEKTAKEKAQQASKAFQKFDINGDGKVSLDELKAGLEKALNLELSETRVQRLLNDFDTNGDGALEEEEFVGIDKFRNQLENIFRQEKQETLSVQQKTKAKEQAEVQLAMLKDAINDDAPTNTDKVLSVLPYLFPLMDSLTFGQFILAQNQDNPVVQGLAVLYGLYRIIPFAPFLSYFGLSFLGDNLAINNLIRFNMKQAIFLDIAQFFPSILATVAAFAAKAGNFEIPPGLTELYSDAVFLTVLLAIGYSAVSSLLGKTPNKIPFISDAVSQRIPSIDMFDMDNEGNLFLKDPETNKDKED